MRARSNGGIDYHQQRFMQISESHCGPAVIQMMLSRLGVDVLQEQVAEAGGAAELIEMNGMRVDQLALAVRRLAPGLRFYVKEHATIDELVRMIQVYHHPVGVEWQGVFEDEDVARYDRASLAWRGMAQIEASGIPVAGETDDDDYGHYSLAVAADRRRRLLTIADPYKDFFAQSRIFDFDVFDRRWYDYNEVPDPLTGKKRLVKDDHLLFVVTRRSALFPLRLGLTSW